MMYLKDLGLGLIKLQPLWCIPSLFILITGLSIREMEKCQAFQESLNSDITAVKHINELDLAKIDNFMNQLIDCKGHLYISGIGWWTILSFIIVAYSIFLLLSICYFWIPVLFICCPGKSGAVGKRLAASLSSVGVAATFVHAAEWGHGDLGEAQHINNNPLWYIPCHHNYDALLMHTHLNKDKKLFACFPFSVTTILQ